MRKSARVLILLLVFMASFVLPIASYEAQSIVSSNVYSQLKQKGQLHNSYYNKESVNLSLVPSSELSKKVATNSWTSSEKPVMVVENLYLLDKSTLGDTSNTNIDYVSKVVRSISTMTGLKYYSNSKKKWETLYKDAYTTNGPKDRTRLSDNTSGSADGKIIYCVQDDSSFGKMNYKIAYNQRAEEVSAIFCNTTPMYVGPVKAVTEGNLCIGLSIIDCGDSFVVYMIVQCKFPVMPLMENTMNDSLSSRLDAIYRWFVARF